MNNGRKLFYNLSASYFNDGIIYEIYSTENFSICNLANQCYALFIFPRSYESINMTSKLGVCGITIRPEHVLEIVRDNSFIANFGLMDKNIIDKRAFLLNSENYNWFKNLKDKNDLNGPTSDIDLVMEEKLRNKGKSR